MGIAMLLKKKKEDKEKPVKIKNSYFSRMSALSKLRLIVGLVFGLSTLGLILMFTNYWTAGGFLALVSYILVLFLMIKLLLAKSL